MHIFTTVHVIPGVNCVIWVALKLPVGMKSVCMPALALQLIRMCLVLQKTRFLFGHYQKVPCCKSVGFFVVQCETLPLPLFYSSIAPSQPQTESRSVDKLVVKLNMRTITKSIAKVKMTKPVLVCSIQKSSCVN